MLRAWRQNPAAGDFTEREVVLESLNEDLDCASPKPSWWWWRRRG